MIMLCTLNLMDLLTLTRIRPITELFYRAHSVMVYTSYLLSSNLFKLSIALLLACRFDIKGWHTPLLQILKHLVSSNNLSCNSNNLGVCDSCCKAKSHRLSFNSSSTIANKPLKLVHCDLWGLHQSPLTMVISTMSSLQIIYLDSIGSIFVQIKVRLLICLCNLRG
jgi:hypothetical protein